MAKDFDPNENTVDEVVKHLEKADEDERARVVAAERKGKNRKGVLEAAGVDANQRTDATGRVLYPWEVDPEDQVRPVQVEETDEARQAREAQLEVDQQVAGSQGGVTPAGSGSAAGGVAGTGAGTTAPGATAATTAAGAPSAPAGTAAAGTTGGTGTA